MITFISGAVFKYDWFLVWKTLQFVGKEQIEGENAIFPSPSMACMLISYTGVNTNQFRASSRHPLSAHLHLYSPPGKHEIITRRCQCLSKAGEGKLVSHPCTSGPGSKRRKHSTMLGNKKGTTAEHKLYEKYDIFSPCKIRGNCRKKIHSLKSGTEQKINSTLLCTVRFKSSYLCLEWL